VSRASVVRRTDRPRPIRAEARPRPVAPRGRAAPSPARRPRRARLTARATLLLVVVGAIAFLSIAPARLYLEQRAELARLSARADRLEAANARLSERAERLRDPAFLERLARQCLGMVRRGEIAFVVVPGDGVPAPPPEC
jgi:cell division protein FtsB